MDSGRSSINVEQALEAVSAPLLVHAGERILYANAAFQRLLGYPLPTLRTMSHQDWATEDFKDALSQYGLRCMSETDPLPALECEALTANGSVRFLEITARRLDSAQGTLVLVTCQDLSDIRFVQNSLLDIGRVMHQILENNPVPTFVIDNHHRVTHWNAACAQLTGMDAGDIVGSTEAWRAFYPEARPLLIDLIVDARVEAEGPHLYGDNLHPSNMVSSAYETEDFFPQFGIGGRWVFCTAAPLMDVQGQTIGGIATLLNVTERHRAEEQLRRHQTELEELVSARTDELVRSHRELQGFLENASVGIVYTSGRQVVHSNKKFLQIFELDAHTLQTLDTQRLFPSAADYKELVRASMPVLRKGQSLVHEMHMRTAKGARIWVQVIAYSSTPGDPYSGVWWLLQDRSEVMRAQEELVRNYREMKQTNARLAEAQSQLLQSEKLASIGQLAAGVAHEINNPVGFVASNLGSLRRYMESMLELIRLYESADKALLPPELVKEIKSLQERADFEFIHEDLPVLLKESEDGLHRVKKIVQDLRDFSRVDQADWQEADLNQGLDSTLNVVMNEVKYKATVKKDYGPLPAVRCLAAQLNQVFMNLIVNASQAIEKRGEIVLKTRQVEDWVCVEVSDNGAGMSPEVLRRIFDPFYTTKPVGKGTGLGLSLSFSIVQKHGGRIEVESTVGVGTTFKVWIPLAGPKAKAA